MVDQTNLAKNITAAFKHLTPNLLENIKNTCNSQVGKVSQSEERDSEEFDQKNNSKDSNEHAEIVDK